MDRMLKSMDSHKTEREVRQEERLCQSLVKLAVDGQDSGGRAEILPIDPPGSNSESHVLLEDATSSKVTIGQDTFLSLPEISESISLPNSVLSNTNETITNETAKNEGKEDGSLNFVLKLLTNTPVNSSLCLSHHACHYNESFSYFGKKRSWPIFCRYRFPRSSTLYQECSARSDSVRISTQSNTLGQGSNTDLEVEQILASLYSGQIKLLKFLEQESGINHIGGVKLERLILSYLGSYIRMENSNFTTGVESFEEQSISSEGVGAEF